MNNSFYNHYKKILEHEFEFAKGDTPKPVWQLIHDKKLTVCPAFKGSLYDKSDLKLMVVGRAVNGWEVDTESCTSLKNTIDMVMQQKDRFDDVVKTDGIKYKDPQTGVQKTYYYSKSNFWKLIKLVLEESKEGENYNQRIVWSNLYKVAPYLTGNPDWKLIKPQMQTYIDCLVDEIRQHKPHNILFITGADYLAPWVKQPQFSKSLNIENQAQVKNTGFTYKTGTFEGSKIVVCCRPERKSDETIKNMALDILELFK